MEPQLASPSSHEDKNLPRLCTGGTGTLVDCIDSRSYVHSGLGVRPGESNPGRMLGAVLLLVVAIAVLGLGLVWWLV